MNASPRTERRERFGERAKFLPVGFVVCTITILFSIYIRYHCVEMIQEDVAVDKRDDDRRSRGFTQLFFFICVTCMLLVCYIRSILQHPGEIPDFEFDPRTGQATASMWQYTGDSNADSAWKQQMNLQEMKKSGDRRHCKWCGKYKPDRCHHCRVCRTCILKMDHHCPWIYNCVGFYNYKYFFLLLLYSVIALHLIMWTMLESVVRSWDEDTPFHRMFFVLFGETLSIFLGILLTTFFFFHIWLMIKAMTTIEFCEKKMPKAGKEVPQGEQVSMYDTGVCGNVASVLGPNPLTWFLPMEPAIGDGLHFVTDKTRLTKELEGGRGIRRKTHQKQQRLPSHRQKSGSPSGTEDSLLPK